MNSLPGSGKSAIAWSDERQRAHAEKLTALASFAQRYRAFLDAMAAGQIEVAERILAAQRAASFVVLLVACVLLSACGGEPFAALDAGDAQVARLEPAADALAQVDAGEHDVTSELTPPGPTLDAGQGLDAQVKGDSGDAGDAAIAVDAIAVDVLEDVPEDVGNVDAGELDAPPACMQTDAGCCQGIGPNWGAAWVGCTHNGGATWCLQTDPLWCIPAGSCACSSTAPSCCSCGMHDVRTLCAP